MKKIIIFALTFAMASTLGFGVVFAGQVETGNGAPSGAHYTLNIIGVPKDKTADMTGNSGHRIFVPLWTMRGKILLTEGDFQVLDANGTDGVAAFQLPNPDENGDGKTEYSVFVRALGKPGGYLEMMTCYTDETGTWCATDFQGGVAQITITRNKGKPTFENVTKDLLFVDYCRTWVEGECTNFDQIPLFGEDLDEYFWEYNNYGLKVAQLRFYEVSTTPVWP